MALTPEQKKEAHRRGLLRKAEREAREAREKPLIASKHSCIDNSDYARFRKIGLNHDEAIELIEKRRLAEQRWTEQLMPSSGGGGVFRGPRGGKYRINRNGRKSYDVP